MQQKTFKLFGFPMFWLRVYLMKVFPRTLLYALTYISTFLYLFMFTYMTY